VLAFKSRAGRRRWPATVIALVLPVAAPPEPDAGGERHSVVSREEILEAMLQSKGFDVTATTNSGRLHAQVILRLARKAHARDPEGPALFVGHAEWFQAFLQATGLIADRAPISQRLAYQYGQDMEIDYQTDHVIREVIEGPPPEFAANIRISWPKKPNGPNEYSYEDRLSVPSLRVTNKRLMSYRLVDYSEIVVFDEIEGLTGQPTSGLLGFLFRILGEGRLVEFRMAISPDGVQVSWGRARKAFLEVATTTTVYPNGHAQKDIPAHRPDLGAIEARLKRPIRVRYQPLARPLLQPAPR
jgi:hypothetical protein